MNVLKVYRSLSAEQKQILANKQVDLNRPIADLLALLKPVAACDRVTDKARTPLGCTIAISVVAAIIVIILAANLESAALFIGGLLVTGGVFIGSLVLFLWTRKIDVSNNMRDFVLPALAVLKEDFDAATPVHVRLDLRPPTAPEKKTSESAPYKHGVYYKIIDRMYVDPWMTFEGVLTDGTKLSWTITDKIRERSKTKKNPRGKIKTKTKYKKRTKIEVEVGMRNKLYDVHAAEVEQGTKRNTVHVEHRVASASLDPIPPKELIDLVAGVYRNAQPAKEA